MKADSEHRDHSITYIGFSSGSIGLCLSLRRIWAQEVLNIFDYTSNK